MELWSNIFLPETGDWATCSVPLQTWRRITEENPGARLIGQFEYAGKTIYAALGTPNQTEGSNQVFMPSWMIDHLGTEGSGESVAVDWLSQDAFPEATRIVLRPHDSAFYHADAKEELERALTRLGVVRQSDTLLIPLECLGGYEIAFTVEITEPANVVLAQGDEVVIEFEEALDAIQPVQPEPIPEEAPIIPLEEEMPQGRRLGGGEAPRIMPDGQRWNPWKHGPWTG